MNKRLFNAAVVIHGGSSYGSVLRRGVLQGYFDRLLAQTKLYAKNNSTPLLIAHEDLPSLAWLSPTSKHRLEDLVKPLSDYVALAPAIRMAIEAFPPGEPGLIVVISDFVITDPEELTRLVDWTLKQHPQVFLKFAFISSENRGNDILPFLLEERPGGPLNMVDALFVTHACGRSGESIEKDFGRKLDVFVALVNAAAY